MERSVKQKANNLTEDSSVNLKLMKIWGPLPMFAEILTMVIQIHLLLKI